MFFLTVLLKPKKVLVRRSTKNTFCFSTTKTSKIVDRYKPHNHQLKRENANDSKYYPYIEDFLWLPESKLILAWSLLSMAVAYVKDTKLNVCIFVFWNILT